MFPLVHNQLLLVLVELQHLETLNLLVEEIMEQIPLLMELPFMVVAAADRVAAILTLQELLEMVAMVALAVAEHIMEVVVDHGLVEQDMDLVAPLAELDIGHRVLTTVQEAAVVPEVKVVMQDQMELLVMVAMAQEYQLLSMIQTKHQVQEQITLLVVA
tara:strand:- start:138 stop:614 length:477 start_codon:yes stop_codon:yes gene_type:complete